MYSCSTSRIDFLFLWSLVCFQADQRLLGKCFGPGIEFKIHQGQEQTLINNLKKTIWTLWNWGTTIWVKESGCIPASPQRHKDVVPRNRASGRLHGYPLLRWSAKPPLLTHKTGRDSDRRLAQEPG